MRKPEQFRAVMAQPPVGKTPHFALHVLPCPPTGEAAALFAGGRRWLGLVVPKRWAKRAVTRNAIRRQVRELARLQSASAAGWPEAAVVVRLRSGFEREDFVSAVSPRLKAAVRAEVQQLFARALFRRPRVPERAPDGSPDSSRPPTHPAAPHPLPPAEHAA